MLIRRKYWKWDHKYDEDEFNLGGRVTDKEIADKLIYDSIRDEDDLIVYNVKDRPYVELSLNKEKEIVKKRFSRGAVIGEFAVRSEFQSAVEKELNLLFEECEESESGLKLTAVFGNCVLLGVILS